jgi:ribosomal-protein-alanine N-acetyltransferase
MTVELRPFAAEDVDAVHRIEVAVGPDPWSASLFADELRGDGSDRLWLVAADQPGGSPIGFGGLLFIADEAHVMNLAVDPAHQRKGIAAHLLSQLLTLAGDRGATGATLEVRASNGPALSLYGRFGFSEAGRRPRYYPDGEDAVIMWAHRIYELAYREHLVALGRTGP